MGLIPESKKNHLWNKVIWHTDPDSAPLGPFHSAEVYCCEESNGYAVWYVRKLPKDDPRGRPGVANGDYLLNYFSRGDRNAAIERAVLISNGAADAERLIAALDDLARVAQRV
jgi:hypothetical protein